MRFWPTKWPTIFSLSDCLIKINACLMVSGSSSSLIVCNGLVGRFSWTWKCHRGKLTNRRRRFQVLVSSFFVVFMWCRGEKRMLLLRESMSRFFPFRSKVELVLFRSRGIRSIYYSWAPEYRNLHVHHPTRTWEKKVKEIRITRDSSEAQMIHWHFSSWCLLIF